LTPHVSAPPTRSDGLEQLRQIWRRRWWVALIAFAAVVAAAATMAYSLPDLYRATTTVLVETQQISESFVRPTVTAELETRLQLIRQEVMSRTRLMNLILQFDLYPTLRRKGIPLDQIIETMRKDIELDLKGVDSQVGGRGPTIAFAISYSGSNPDIVATISNALAKLYVDSNTKIREGQAVRTAEFLKSQLAEIKQQLDGQQLRASQFKLSHIGELPQQVEANLAALDRLNTQLRLNGENQLRTLDRRERLQKQLVESESARQAAPQPAAAAVSAQSVRLTKAKEQLADLQRRFTDAYPDVVRLRAEVATLEKEMPQPLASRSVAAPDTKPADDPAAQLKAAIADADTELNALKQEEVSFRGAIAAYEQRVENVPKRQEEFQALSRDYEATKERYDTLLKRYEEARLAENLEQDQNVEQLRILDPAIPPRDPSAPGRLRLLALGVFVAAAFAAAAVFAVEKLDSTFHDVDDLRSFVAVPALYSIPRIVTDSDTRRQWRRAALVTVAAMVSLTLIVAASRRMAVGNEQIVRMTARGHA